MKKILILFAGVLALLALVMGFLTYQTRKEDPRYILNQLRRGKGDQDKLIMRFALTRGDRVMPLIDAFSDEQAPGSFRALVVGMLCARHSRDPDDRIAPVLAKALDDPDPLIRRQVAKNFAFLVGTLDLVAIAAKVTDTDPEVRRQAYLVFGTDSMNAGGDVWSHLSPEQRDQLAADCVAMAKKEDAPQLRFLAMAVVGRRVEILLDRARQAQHSADLAQAEQLYEAALQLDPENHQARIRKVRYYLDIQEKEKAMQTADTYHAVLRIPRLPEAPVIDGDPTDKVWQSALTNEQNFYRNTSRWTGIPAEGITKAYVGHHGGKLYIAIIGYEEDLDKLHITRTKRDDQIWRDDCVELLFDLRSEGVLLYQFIVNPLNVVQDLALQRGVGENVRLNYKFETGAKVFKERGYAQFDDAGKADSFGQRVAAEPDWQINLGQVVEVDGKVRVYYWSDSAEGRAGAKAEVKKLGGTTTSPYWGFEFAINPKVLNGKPITKDSLWGMSIIRTRIGPGSEQTAWWPTFGGSQKPDLFPLAVFEGL